MAMSYGLFSRLAGMVSNPLNLKRLERETRAQSCVPDAEALKIGN
jgi:hypothetical protein